MDAAAMNVAFASATAQENSTNSRLAAIKRPGAQTQLDPAKVRKTAEEFETVFLEQMFNHMFNTVGVDGVTGGGMGEESTRSMLVNAYAKNIAKAGGIGLAPSIASEIIKIQEKANGTAR
ncbi:MAG: rod-binding protein [Rhodospirillales bacterium]|nr:rod-binding protein [Rhodospirillales bacterium]